MENLVTDISTCPSDELIGKVSFDIKFFSLYSMKLLRCIIQKSISEDPEKVLEKAQKVTKTNLVAVRIPNNGTLLKEAYTGIVYLNDLRSVTTSFKFVFGYSENHMYEEYISNVSLKSVLPSCNKEKVLSIIAQLFSALNYANSKSITGFPHEIYIRNVEEASYVPIYFKNQIKYVPTFGMIPVFVRFNDLTNKPLNQEQADLYSYIRENLSQEVKNSLPNECKDLKFDELYKENPQNILSCNETELCSGIDNLVHPYIISTVRDESYIESVKQRVKELEPSKSKYMVALVLNEYYRILHKFNPKEELKSVPVPKEEHGEIIKKAIEKGKQLKLNKSDPLIALRDSIRYQNYLEVTNTFPGADLNLQIVEIISERERLGNFTFPKEIKTQEDLLHGLLYGKLVQKLSEDQRKKVLTFYNKFPQKEQILKELKLALDPLHIK